MDSNLISKIQLSRRNLLIGLGSLLGIAPCALAYPVQDRCGIKYFALPNTENRCFGFVSTGAKGDALNKNLFSFFKIKIKPNAFDIGSHKGTKEHDLIIKSYFKDNVIFLAGSIHDPNFWKARDLILSNSPDFLWLIGFYSEREPLIKQIRISGKETISLFHRFDNDLLKATELVLTIYNMFSSPSLIGFDFVDLANIVKENFNTHLCFECDLNDYGLPYGRLLDFKSFLIKRSDELNRSQGAFVSMFYGSDDNWKLTDLNEAISMFSELTKPGFNMAFSCNENQITGAEFRASIIMPVER